MDVQTFLLENLRARLSLPLRRSSMTRRSYGARLPESGVHQQASVVVVAVAIIRCGCPPTNGFI
jgi:hypothetical protein